MLAFVQNHPYATVIVGALVAYFVRFSYGGYKLRKLCHNSHALPGHSMLWGSLKQVGEMQAELPYDAHPHVMSYRLSERYGCKDAYFYLDLWPVSSPMLVILDPRLAQQATVEDPFLKSPSLAAVLDPLAGKDNIISVDGPVWKKWRSIMNPGFAATHLMSLVPGIVDDCTIFLDKVAAYATSGEVFRLEEALTCLTVDIIGKVAMDVNLDTQRAPNELIQAFREQVHLVPQGTRLLDPLYQILPWTLYKQWRNSRIMVRYIGKILDERFTKAGTTAPSAANGTRKPQRKRAVIDLALESYQAQKAGSSPTPQQKSSTTMDPEFRRLTITQIRSFLFAGHDTTSSLLCYALYLLKKHPTIATRLRREHDTILGSDISQTPALIKKDPYILNKLDYTLAVIKETLRLFPPASAVRQAGPNSILRDPDTGEILPLTPDVMVWVASWGMHRHPQHWGDTAELFDPSRFLSENESKIPPGAWRPFEKGPRNCIGQELALIEARVALAMTVRSFDFEVALDPKGLEEVGGDGSMYAVNEEKLARAKGPKDWHGEELYPVLIGTAKPRAGMPVRVVRREGS